MYLERINYIVKQYNCVWTWKMKYREQSIHYEIKFF